MFAIPKVGHQYITKDDQESNDFMATDFTQNNTWLELDLSSIIPVGTVLVHFYLYMRSGTDAGGCSFAPSGYSANYIYLWLSHIFQLRPAGFDFWLPVFADRKIKYKVPALTWYELNLNVVGWFK